MERKIIENGKCFYHIVTSQFADEGELFAATTLKEYLFKATGAIVPYFSDRCEKQTAEIRIGRNVRGHKDRTEGLSPEGFAVFTDGEDIVITSPTPRGVIYGVFGFLERFFGYRHFEKGVERLTKTEVFTAEDLSFSENPAFEYRDVYFRGAFDTDFAVHNRLNTSLALIPYEMGGKLKFYNFHHSFYDILPPEIYYAEHPEYYSYENGERRGKNGQLCLTNEGAITEATKRVKEWIRRRPDCKVFSVAQNDWDHYCTCESCREMNEREGSEAGSNIYFVNRIAAEVEKEFPDVLIHTFAYRYTRRAPKYIKPRDNVIVRLCNIECSWDEPMQKKAENDGDSPAAEFLQNITDWGKITKHLYVWDYACDFAFYLLPFPNYRVLAENMRLYREKGVVGILQQGNFAYGKQSGFAGLESYLAARLMWNTELDTEELINEYLNGVFGSSAGYIKEYIDLLCNAAKGTGMTLYYTPQHKYLTDELVNKADMLMQKALENAESDEIRERIELEYLSLRFLKIARSPLEEKGRNERIDELYRDTVRFGISEIQERLPLEASFERLRRSRYCQKESYPTYRLYYIMK